MKKKLKTGEEIPQCLKFIWDINRISYKNTFHIEWKWINILHKATVKVTYVCIHPSDQSEK